MDLGILNLKFQADCAEFIRDIGKSANAVEKAHKQISSAITGINRSLAGIGIGLSIGAIVKKMVAEFSQAEAAAKKVDAVLRATGGAAGVTAKQVDELANTYSRLTGIDDDVIKDAEAMLLTFKNIGKDAFPQATKAVLDISAAMGVDLKTASIQVGKALDNPKQGMVALQKAGLGFSESQKKLITQLQDSGKLYEAQKIELKALEDQIGGVAAAMRDTLPGALQALDTSFGNLFAAMAGGKPADLFRTAIEALILAMDDLTDTIPKVEEGIANIGKDAQLLFSGIVDGLSIIKTAADSTVGFINNIGSSIDVVGGYIAGMTDQLKPAFEFMSGFSKGVGDALNVRGAFDAFFERLNKRMAEIHANAEKGNKSLQAQSQAVSDIDKKRKDELKTLADILQAERDKLTTKKLTIAQDYIGLANLEAQEKVSKLIHLTEQERNTAKKTLISLLIQEKEIESGEELKKRTQALNDEVKALQAKYQGKEQEYELEKKIRDINADPVLLPEAKKKLIEATKAQADKTKYWNDELEKQQKYLDDVKSSSENWSKKLADLNKALDAGTISQQQYKAATDAIIEVQKKADEDAQKRINDINDEIAAIKAKQQGREDEFELLKKIRDINADPNLSPKRALEEAAAVSQLADARKADVEWQERNKAILDKVKGGTLSYKQSLDLLNQAQKDSAITAKQAGDALKDLNDDKLKKLQQSTKNFTSNLLNDLTDAITQGKSLTDVIKNLALQLAKTGAQKFLFDPISNKISQIASNWYKNNFLQSVPGAPGSQGTAASAPQPILTGGVPSSGSASGTTPGGILGGLAAGPIGSSPAVAATQQAQNFDSLVGNVADCKTITTEGPAWRVKIVQDAIKVPPGFKPYKPYSGSSKSSGSSADGDNVIPFLRRFEGATKGGPAFRVIENCPCPTTGIPGKSGTTGGGSGTGTASVEAGDPLTALLSLFGLGGLLSALKNMDSPASALAGITSTLNDMSNTLKDILQKMAECCAATKTDCGCGGGSGGGGGIPAFSTGSGAPFNPLGPLGSGPIDNAGGGGFGFNPASLKGGVSHYTNGVGYSPLPYQPLTPTVGSFGSAPTVLQGSVLSSAQTGQALQQANTLANAQTTAAYANGQISWAQAQTAYLTRQNSQLTQAASGYQMTPQQAYGPAINLPFILQGSPYAGTLDPQYEDDATTSVTGKLLTPIKGSNSPGWNPQGLPTQWGGWAPSNAKDVPANTILDEISKFGPSATRTGQRSQSIANSASNNFVAPNNPYGLVPWKRFANGGTPPVGVPSLVGERGPEMFVPQQSGTVLSNDKVASMFGGGGAPKVSITNNTGVEIQTSDVEWSDGHLKMAVGQVVANAPNNPRAQKNMKKNARGLSRRR